MKEVMRYVADDGKEFDNPTLCRSYEFMCMDTQFREWGQPYFAINPDQGKQIQLD